MRDLGLVLLALSPVVLILALVFVHGQMQVASFREQCVAADGHTYGTGLHLCLDDTGRVIEVYP